MVTVLRRMWILIYIPLKLNRIGQWSNQDYQEPYLHSS